MFPESSQFTAVDAAVRVQPVTSPVTRCDVGGVDPARSVVPPDPRVPVLAMVAAVQDGVAQDVRAGRRVYGDELAVVTVTYSPGRTLDGFLDSLATATSRCLLYTSPSPRDS